MKGTNEFHDAFNGKCEQVGRLAAVPGSHARGDTFRLFVLPEGEAAIWNGSGNAPLNKEAVEVYGVTSGQRGWTETYGWIRYGKWKEDFLHIVEQRQQHKNAESIRLKVEIEAVEEERRRRIEKLLSDY